MAAQGQSPCPEVQGVAVLEKMDLIDRVQQPLSAPLFVSCGRTHYRLRYYSEHHKARYTVIWTHRTANQPWFFPLPLFGLGFPGTEVYRC